MRTLHEESRPRVQANQEHVEISQATCTADVEAYHANQVNKSHDYYDRKKAVRRAKHNTKYYGLDDIDYDGLQREPKIGNQRLDVPKSKKVAWAVSKSEPMKANKTKSSNKKLSKAAIKENQRRFGILMEPYLNPPHHCMATDVDIDAVDEAIEYFNRPLSAEVTDEFSPDGPTSPFASLPFHTFSAGDDDYEEYERKPSPILTVKSEVPPVYMTRKQSPMLSKPEIVASMFQPIHLKSIKREAIKIDRKPASYQAIAVDSDESSNHDSDLEDPTFSQHSSQLSVKRSIEYDRDVAQCIRSYMLLTSGEYSIPVGYAVDDQLEMYHSFPE
jgi:hypothetical protein